ncbi:hypothetical protein U1Q18_029457 [Sarracenia purpurea var. burkii]
MSVFFWQVLNDGVRLSSNLSCTLGDPTSGSIIFVFPIQSQATMGVDGNDKLHSRSMNCLSLSNCKELYLELVSSTTGFAKNGSMLSGKDFPGERTHGQFEIGKISSPMTPLYSRSRLGSPVTSQLSSPKYGESISTSPNLYETSINSFNIIEVLRDETAKNLLQTCATSWLCSRSLFCGNFVTIPILSKICIFRVIGARGISANCTNEDLTDKFNGELYPHASDMMDHVDDVFMVNPKTKVHFFSPLNSALETSQKRALPGQELECENTKIDLVDDSLKLGGLAKEYAELKYIILSSSVNDISSTFGLRPTKGVLLHGPPGTGKTSLVQKCAHDTGINLFTVNGPEIFSQYYGESEQALQEVFDSASRATPAVIFIDELDAIAPARRDGGEELSQRMVAALLTLMDGICRTDGLLVTSATNRPDSIEPALRRPGRFDKEIEIGDRKYFYPGSFKSRVPSSKQRYDILLAYLSEMEHSLSEMQVQHLATTTYGFVGADLAALCNEANFTCFRRHVDFKKLSDDSDSNGVSIAHDAIEEGFSCSSDTPDFASSSFTYLSNLLKMQNGVDVKVNRASVPEEYILKVAFEDFEKAKMEVKPSAMREVILEVPKVKWEDVGGHKEVKTQLMDAVEWPQKHQDAFKRMGTRPPTGILMFRPPGCSKTHLARAVATEAGLNFLAVKGPEIFSSWVGESEKAVRSVFAMARANAPSIIFFDEIESLAAIRGKEGDGVSVADRVTSQLLVELDGLERRSNVTVIAATNRPDDIDPALLRPGYTGADISLICRVAALAALEESFDASSITMEHLKAAIKQVEPSEIESYQELSVKFQSEPASPWQLWYQQSCGVVVHCTVVAIVVALE